MEMPKNKRFNDLTNRRFGRLIVLEYAGVKIVGQGHKRHQWLCKCDCGKEKVILAGCLLGTNNTQSCGCLQKDKVRERLIDLTNQRFGKLIAVSCSHHHANQPYWLCKCDCGNETLAAGNNLKSGKTKSCGCRQGRYTHGMWGKPGYKKLYLSDPVKKLKHNIGGAIRDVLKSKKNRSRIFDYLPYSAEDLKVHLENQFEDWMSWDNYGGKNNNKEKTWHIDHIVPQVQFTYTSMSDPQFQECWKLENLRPLEKIANMKKGGRTE